MKSIKHLIIYLLLTIPLLASNQVQDSIVKIYTVSKLPDYSTPWNSNMRRSNGSGSIILGNRILTNAHVVANQTFIEVKRHGDTNRYQAQVEYISHQADLALLKLEDESFFKGTTSLEFDGLPDIQQEVTLYGFPMGGHSLSVTNGVVSRIEHTRYAHSKEIFLSIQIDAAVNPGNSGGPAISDGKIVGVVMQQISNSQNIGYLVPVEVVKHFLDDIKDKKYDGFPHLGISTERLNSEALRNVYKMDKDTTGVLLIDISETSTAKEKLKKGDVIISICGNKIENDGTIEYRHNQYTSYKYFIDAKQLGETITLGILRDGKKKVIDIEMTNIADDDLLVNTVFYDVMPKYFIYGGYTFVPLTRNLLMSTNATLLQLRESASQWATDEKEEVVVLLKVLASKISRGDHNFSYWIVDKVNDKEFKNFKEFIEIIKNFKGEYLVFENKDGIKVAVDRKKALEIEKTILERYSIESSSRL